MRWCTLFVLYVGGGGCAGPDTTTEGQGVQGTISAKAKAPFSAPKG